MIDDLVSRAIRAYWIAETKEGSGANVPTQPSKRSSVINHDGLKYVVLCSVGGVVIAVYRVRSDTGLLRRLKRWPAALCTS